MSIMDSLREHVASQHPCTHCRHRDGEHCKWSDSQRATPRHVTWFPINWDEPDDYADCPASAVPGADEWEG